MRKPQTQEFHFLDPRLLLFDLKLRLFVNAGHGLHTAFAVLTA